MLGVEHTSQETRRSLFERLFPFARKSLESARPETSEFYDKQGFHIPLKGNPRGTTFFKLNPDDTRRSVQHSEDIVRERQKVYTEKNKNAPVEDREKNTDNVLLGGIAEGVAFSVLSRVFAPPEFQVMPATVVDDELNGSDIFVFKKNPDTGEVEQVFGIDVTSAPEPDILAKKMVRSLVNTVRGKMGHGSFLKTSHNGNTQLFSSARVIKLMLPISEQTALAQAQYAVRGESVQDVGVESAILSSFKTQIKLHEQEARSKDVKKILAGAHTVLDSIVLSPAVQKVDPNMLLLNEFHAHADTRSNLLSIVRRIIREHVVGTAISMDTYAPAIQQAVFKYMPVPSEHEPIRMSESFSQQVQSIEDTLALLRKRVAQVAERTAQVRKRTEALEARIGFYV